MTNSTLTPQLATQFKSLACSLSPENLACDGELNQSQVNAKYRRLKAQWSKLEKLAGRKVSETEAWRF